MLGREQLILGKLTRKKYFAIAAMAVQREKSISLMRAHPSFRVEFEDHFQEVATHNLVGCA
jgi:hypothetical protein